MSKKIRHQFQLITGLPVVAGDDHVIYAAEDTDPRHIVYLLQNNFCRAVVIQPSNKEEFIQNINALTEDQREKIIDTIKKSQPYKSDVPAEKQKDFQNTDYPEFPEFIRQIIQKMITIGNSVHTKHCKILNVFSAEAGKVAHASTMHTDTSITVHCSLWGAPLEFIAGPLDDWQTKTLRSKTEKAEQLLKRIDDEPEWLQFINAVEPGSICIFNSDFWHRSPRYAREIGQLTLAYYAPYE